MPTFPSDVESHRMEGDVVAAATQVSVKLSTQLPEPFKVPEDALVTLPQLLSSYHTESTPRI